MKQFLYHGRSHFLLEEFSSEKVLIILTRKAYVLNLYQLVYRQFTDKESSFSTKRKLLLICIKKNSDEKSSFLTLSPGEFQGTLLRDCILHAAA